MSDVFWTAIFTALPLTIASIATLLVSLHNAHLVSEVHTQGQENSEKVGELHMLLNSRLTEMMTAAVSEAMAKGMALGMAAGRAEGHTEGMAIGHATALSEERAPRQPEVKP